MIKPSPIPTRPILLRNPATPAIVGKFSALLALACLLTHIPLLVAHFTSFPMITAAMASVACVCVPCSWRLWRSPTTHDFMAVASVAAIMVILHVVLALSMASSHPAGSVPMSGMMHGSGTPSIEGPTSFAETTMIGHAQPMLGATERLFQIATGLATFQIVFSIVIVTGVVVSEKRHRRACGARDGARSRAQFGES